MSVQLFVKAVNTAQYQRLDLFETEPIKLTMSVANIQDPLAANSVFSRTFRVPHTSANGPFFKAAFNVNATDFDASKKAEAYINDNGVFFSVGNIRLTAIFVNEKTSNIEYEINYYGETSDFGSKIGGGFLSEVNLTQYNHALSYNNVVNSWSGGLLGGNVVYPLIEWGYVYTNGVPQPKNGTLSIGGVKSFTGPTANKALNYPQLKPVLKAKALWDAIFNETGYTYDSSFIETDPLFTNLFVVAENEARALINPDISFEANDGGALNDVGANGPGSLYPNIIDAQFPIEITDPSNSYNPTLSQYTAETPGTYIFEINGFVELLTNIPLASTAVLFSIVDVNTGTVLSTTSPLTITTPSSFSKVLAATLTAGQVVKLRIENIGPTGNSADYVSFFGCNWLTTSVPSTIVMSSFMPTNIRKVDFMRSIINRFRLVFVPSRDNEKHFTITPWKDWVLQGTQRDWTNKLDGTKDLKLTPLFYGQERLQVYKDQEDADFVNYNYQLDYKQTYGQRNVDSNNELIKGTKEYKDQFATTPLYPIGGTNPTDAAYAFLIPHLAKDTDTERQPIQPKLRLVYYNGLQPAPLTWYINQNWNSSSQTGSSPQPHTTYPLMSQFSTYPVNSATFDLNWENEFPLYDTETSGLSKNTTTLDCFNVFWKTWYDTMFDPFSRIVQANFVLGYDDVLDLKFNDYIFVKDAWYLVNKITDYVIGEETNCRVELVKVGNNIGLTVPPSFPTKNLVEDICYASTACEAFCCNTGGVSVGQYYITGSSWGNATAVFLDPFGQVPAPNGYYSNGVITYNVANGVVLFGANTAGCVCNPPLLTQFTVCYGSTSCEACCCINEEIQVWGTGLDLVSSLNVYLDSLGTIPANGWYKATSETDAIEVINGSTFSIGICSACNCNPTPIFEHQVTFNDESLCQACCTGSPVTIYTDSATFINSTVVYIDNVPLTLSGAGWYALNGDVLVVDGNGNVTAIGTCSGCACLNYYIAENCQSPGLTAHFSHTSPLNIGDVVSSPIYANQCWTIIDTSTFGDPITNIYPDCATCLPSTQCTCVEYNVFSLSGGAVQYIDCTDGDVYYLDIPPGFDQNFCACQDSIIVLQGKIKVTPVAPCDVPENEILVEGQFSTYDSTISQYFALTDSNGDVQDSFTTQQGGLPSLNNNAANALATNDYIFITGNFTTYNGVTVNRLVKVDYTGNIDNSYNPSIGLNFQGQSLAKFSDGAILLGGVFTTFNNISANKIVAFQPDGTIDPIFDYGTGFNNTINKVIIKNDIAYCLGYSSSLYTYKGGTGSRFVALDRNGNLIANYGLASTDIPLTFNFDVDDLNRVYLTYVSSDLERIIVERWLPSGSPDPTYYFELALPNLVRNSVSWRVPSIKVNDSYDCFVSINRDPINDPYGGAYLIKVRSSAQLDLTFGTNLLDGNGQFGNIEINDDAVYLPMSSDDVSSIVNYNGTPVSSLIKVDQTTGQLIPAFNNNAVTVNPIVWRLYFKQ